MPVALPFVSVPSADGSAAQITTMFAQTMRFASNLVVQTADVDGVTMRTIYCGGYCRILLATWDGAGGNSELDAGNLLSWVGAGLGAHYTVSLRSDGYVQIAYGALGDAAITWTGAEALRNTLGFSGTTTTIYASQGSVVVAPYPPMGVLYSGAVLDASPWVPSPTDAALATSNGGRTYGWSARTALVRKRFTLGWHPRTWAERVRLGSLLTPAFPEDTGALPQQTRWTYPAAPPSASLAPPWSVHEFLATSRTSPVAAVFGGFQQLGGAVRYCDLGYWTAESSLAEQAFVHGVAAWSARVHRTQLELTRRMQLDMLGT